MRNKVAVLFVIAGLILCLSGCKPAGQKETFDESRLEKAKTVHDVSYLMTNNEDELIYSECKDDKPLHFYFDMLGSEEYIKVNHKGKNYLLLWYRYYSYSDYIKEVESVEKSFRGNELQINVKAKTAEFESGVYEGCFPNGSRVRLILSLESDINIVYLSGRICSRFNGGRIKIGQKEGIVDKDLNFIVPPVYDGIYDLETFGESSCPRYYRVYKKDGGNGVLDNNYNRVLSDSYGNIYYINENKFIVGITKDEDKPELDEIAIVDGKENTVKKMQGFLNASDQIHLHTAEEHIQICDPSYGSNWGHGIIDQDLNIIIEPVYQNIYWHNGIYRVEDYTGKTLRFYPDGKKVP